MKKNLVKIVRSVHADHATLNAMYFGYFLLLLVSAVMIYNKSNLSAHDNMVSSQVKTEQLNKH